MTSNIVKDSSSLNCVAETDPRDSAEDFRSTSTVLGKIVGVSVLQRLTNCC